MTEIFSIKHKIPKDKVMQIALICEKATICKIPRMNMLYEVIAMPIILEKTYPLCEIFDKTLLVNGKNNIPNKKKTNHHCNSKSISDTNIGNIYLADCICERFVMEVILSEIFLFSVGFNQ